MQVAAANQVEPDGGAHYAGWRPRVTVERERGYSQAKAHQARRPGVSEELLGHVDVPVSSLLLFLCRH